MNRIIILLAIMLVVGKAAAQTSLGGKIGFIIDPAIPEGQALDNTFNIDMTLKKYLSKDFNLVSGVGFRFYDVSVPVLPLVNDAISYAKDRDPNQFFYPSNYDYFRFSYLVVPIGIEFKVTTFLRLQYAWENNILLGSNSTVDEYVQYGNKAVAPVMGTHHAALLLHGGKAFGIYVAGTFKPTFFRNDIEYTYDYMNQWKSAMNDSYLFTFGIWADMSYKKRKKV